MDGMTGNDSATPAHRRQGRDEIGAEGGDASVAALRIEIRKLQREITTMKSAMEFAGSVSQTHARF
jgi:hypothetical protein